jgi:NAD(P)H-hydrate epimerase
LRAIGELLKLAQKVDALAIGPGLGTNFETRDAIRRFLARTQLPTVIDADALNALADGFEDIVPTITAPSVMTPHAGELSRILGVPIEQIANQRVTMAEKWATDLFTTLVIKGNPTIIACAQKSIHLNVTGNDGMAKAGAGDVLTGIVSSFAAQGLSMFDAARLGTYVHGLAVDIAARCENHRAMLARHIIEGIGAAFDELESTSQAANEKAFAFDTNFVLSDLGAGIYSLSCAC